MAWGWRSNQDAATSFDVTPGEQRETRCPLVSRALPLRAGF